MDQAQILLRLGLPLYPGEAQERLDKVPSTATEELIRLGVVKEQGEGGPLLPNWTLRINYYWEQVFPARTELTIDHRYKPIVGGTVPVPLSVLRNELRGSFYRPYCVDDDILGSLREASYGPTWIAYILTTGGNWSGPIGRFRLVVDKGSPSNLVSFCAEGVKKISPTQFEVTKTNFIPQQDLSILILTPSRDPDAGPHYSGDLSSYDCDELWDKRNSLFKAAGYCFKTPRAITRFGNAGCSYDSQNDVPLSAGDRNIVEQIKAIETSKNCQR